MQSDIIKPINDVENNDAQEEACLHFLKGFCRFGSHCCKSHSIFGKLPTCCFFLAGTCSKGNQCPYPHAISLAVTVTRNKTKNPESSLLRPCVPVLQNMILDGGAKCWYSERASALMMVRECNFNFTRSLCTLNCPPYISSIFNNINNNPDYV
jgi:hypothetical protein